MLPTDNLPKAERLLALLDAEFEALKTQDLTAFEAYQAEKAVILDELGALTLPRKAPKLSCGSPFER